MTVTMPMTAVHSVAWSAVAPMATAVPTMSACSSGGHCRNAQSDSSGNSDRKFAKYFSLQHGANAPVMHMGRATKDVSSWHIYERLIRCALDHICLAKKKKKIRGGVVCYA